MKLINKKKIEPHVFKILKLAGTIADTKRYRVFAVGGFVRDILLNVKNFDVDIVVEGNGLIFAKELAKELNGSLVIHKRFGTATVVTERFKIDIATARKERYEYPAALPKVSFSSIRQDLYRRDFTMNAMAVSLNKRSFGELIDFFNGQADLRSKKIRVMHDLSFIDDPTRIFRAVRFEQRYDFAIEPHTKNLIKTAVGFDMFDKTQKQRLRNELILILSEETPLKAIMRMHQLHELRFIHPKLKLIKKMPALFKDIDNARKWYEISLPDRQPLDNWIIYFMAMIDNLNLTQVKGLCEKFVFTKADKKRIVSSKIYARKIIESLKARKELLPSEIYKYLEPISYELIIFIRAKSRIQITKKRISLFFKQHNRVKLSISGEDLKALGMTPGLEYRRILNKILYDKLDGKISGKKEELKLAEKLSSQRKY